MVQVIPGIGLHTMPFPRLNPGHGPSLGPFVGSRHGQRQLCNVLNWSTADNPAEAATDMGQLLIGVNCTLPTNMILSTIVMNWNEDNGV